MGAVRPGEGGRGGVGGGATLPPQAETLDLTRFDAGGFDDRRAPAGALFESVAQPVALLDCRGDHIVYVTANRAYLWAVGGRDEDVAGRRLGDLLPGATALEATRRVLEVVRSGRPRRDHDVLVTPRGRRSMESTLVPVGPDGTQILIVLNDRTDADDVAAALASSEQRFTTLADASPTGIFALDPEGNCTYTNARLQEIAGRSAGELSGRGWVRTLHLEDRRAFAAYQRAAAAGGTDPVRVRLRRPGGDLRWVEVRTATLRDTAGTAFGYVGTADDITEQVQARRVADELAGILQETTDLVAVSGPDGRFRWMNGAARTFHRLAPGDDVSQVGALDVYPEWARRKFVREVAPALDGDGRWSGELVLRSLRHGGELHVHQSVVVHRGAGGAVESYSSIARDISERKAFEAQLTRQALHDTLTGLPNRPLFMDRLGQALARAGRLGLEVAVLSLDVDRFQVVNDSLGHDAGDQLLTALAHRLRSVLRPSDSIARLAGDEFVILCEDAPRRGIDIARRIEEAMAAPFVLDEGEIYLTASIGIAATDTPRAADAEVLLRDADAAMYRAKERGRARYEVVDEGLRERAALRTATETALRRALEHDDLVVHYQPLVSLEDGRVVAVEALARWRHPERGLLLPSDFIPLAEEAGLIVPVGEQILRSACAQLAAWRERKDWPPMLWVNLSARQLNHLALLDTLKTALHDYGLDAECLGFEITESVLMEDAASTVASLEELRRLGVGVAIDDFGTGYSSLTYLKRFPVTTLKVDRSFVDGLGRQPEDSAIVSAQVGMAHALGLSVIAEGVETETQRQLLRSMNCDLAQGYLFAPPLPPAALEDVLDRDPRW